MRGEPSSPTLQQENVPLGAQARDQDLSVCSMFASAALPQRQGRHCLIGSTAARRRCFCVTFFREIFKSFKSFKDKNTSIKSSMQKETELCASWSMHTACKDTPTHSYGVHLEQHPHLRQPKYNLSHITHHKQNAEPVHSSGQAAAGRPLASRAPRLLPPYLLLYAGSGGGGGGGGSSKIRGRDRLLAAPTLE